MNQVQQRLNDIDDNPHLIQFYANKKCKDCYGRGYRELEVCNERTNFKWIEYKKRCPCVLKSVKKEVKELTDG